MNESRSDTDLLEAWRTGDNTAGSTLVRRHFDALHRFFANKASGYEEDLVQQTFVATTESKHEFRGESSFRAYLFGLARYQLLTHYRKKYRGPAFDFITTSIRDLGTSPTSALSRQEERHLLELALQQIPVDQQIALELTYWEELTAADVARVLDIPENTVYSRIRRAKAHLREELSRLTAEPASQDAAIALLTKERD
jgi:RNA polymerase sigma-70 factor (ECF subfamily)